VTLVETNDVNVLLEQHSARCGGGTIRLGEGKHTKLGEGIHTKLGKGGKEG